MSISHVFANLPPVAYPLAAGLLCTSPMLFGNVGLSLVGPIPMIKGQLGSIHLDGKQRVRMWSLFFSGAAVGSQPLLRRSQADPAV